MSEPRGKRNWQVCQFIVNTDTFSLITTDEAFKVNKGPLNCHSKKVAYLSERKKCKNPYVSKAQTKFCIRLSNYKIVHKILINPPQLLFLLLLPLLSLLLLTL